MYICHMAYYMVYTSTLHIICLRAGKELPMEPGRALSERIKDRSRKRDLPGSPVVCIMGSLAR